MEPQDRTTGSGGTSLLVLVLAWLAVGLPMLWGVWTTMKKASLLFR
jgi:hypothetical protein